MVCGVVVLMHQYLESGSFGALFWVQMLGCGGHVGLSYALWILCEVRLSESFDMWILVGGDWGRRGELVRMKIG